MNYKDHVPHNAPTSGNVVLRFVGRIILRLLGYKIKGSFANHKKMVLIGAPHTSNWDLILGIGMIYSLSIRIAFMMKKEAFIFPASIFFKSLGGIPINRTSAKSVVDESIDALNNADKLWLTIIPEGTRKSVDKLKTGFMRIAEGANVPIFVIAVDSRTKTLYLHRLVKEGETVEELHHYFKDNFSGINPKNN